MVGGMNIQINGRAKSQETKKAERFFSERRVEYHLRDIVEKPLSPREIETICRSIDPEDLIDTEGKRYRERGLEFVIYDPRTEIAEDPALLRLPIVRNGNAATAGYDPDTWKRWIESDRS
jgi:arsenate reductase (glutaredoxin)